MCGIVGIISNTKVSRLEVTKMAQRLTHRGPDYTGVFISENETVALGHTRLSIIDLSKAANQPLFSKDKRYVIIFNGEIYNFFQLRNLLQTNHHIRFQTNSDTEVIVEAFSIWGLDIATKLQGMFAIVIYDTIEHAVYLLRDRMGKKPIFYYQSGNLFAFASEIKALLQHPVINQDKKINRKIISGFLHLGYIPEPETGYQNIFKFPSGSTGIIDKNLKITIQPYWKITDTIIRSRIANEAIAKKKLDELVDQAVCKRLISDVPLGTFLSGGTDSSLVTAYASRHVNNLKTFSLGFKENKFDESKYANQVAKQLGTEHTEYILAEKEAVDLVELYLAHFDEPFVDSSAVPTMLVSKLARQEIKVALTGDGGDELFQGYGAYTWANRLENPFFKIIKNPLHSILKNSGNSRWMRVAHLLESNKNIRSHIFSQEQYLFTEKEIQENILASPSDFQFFAYKDYEAIDSKLSGGEKQALFDLQYYLKDDLLVKVDRASMYYALECRSPLLDNSIVEYALNLDVSLKKKGNINKWILKELLSDFLPSNLVHRQKWGFSIPLVHWLKNDLRYLLDDYLNNQLIEEIGIFNPTYIQQLKKEFFNGKDYLYNRLWTIIVLHKWWRQNQ